MVSPPAAKPAVLVVEDEDAIAYVLQYALEEDGWAVHRASSGKEAKDLIGRLPPPSLVTLDIALPDMSGVELILHIKDTPGWQRVPIVMVTGTPKDEAVNWAVKSGAKGYILKPFKPEEVVETVRRLARRHESR